MTIKKIIMIIMMRKKSMWLKNLILILKD